MTTNIVKDVEGEMMRTLRRPRKMAKLRSVDTKIKIVKDVEEEMMKRLWRPRQRGIRMSRRK